VAPDGSTTLSCPRPPDEVIDEVRPHHLAPDARARQGVRTWSADKPACSVSANRPAVQAGHRGTGRRQLERTIDDLVVNVLSLSSTALHRFRWQLAGLEPGVRATLEQVPLVAIFAVRRPDTGVGIWRPFRVPNKQREPLASEDAPHAGSEVWQGRWLMGRAR
jgi:hypothetical protein